MCLVPLTGKYGNTTFCYKVSMVSRCSPADLLRSFLQADLLSSAGYLTSILSFTPSLMNIFPNSIESVITTYTYTSINPKMRSTIVVALAFLFLSAPAFSAPLTSASAPSEDESSAPGTDLSKGFIDVGNHVKDLNQFFSREELELLARAEESSAIQINDFAARGFIDMGQLRPLLGSKGIFKRDGILIHGPIPIRAPKISRPWKLLIRKPPLVLADDFEPSSSVDESGALDIGKIASTIASFFSKRDRLTLGNPIIVPTANRPLPHIAQLFDARDNAGRHPVLGGPGLHLSVRPQPHAARDLATRTLGELD
ncbi:unnamed protein product [Somion occarium]|uniref:Uncharacterized protein n=1 Tax=Somion occarium TaxID=3059160 RepID=A0ABP1E8D0_9APHY